MPRTSKDFSHHWPPVLKNLKYLLKNRPNAQRWMALHFDVSPPRISHQLRESDLTRVFSFAQMKEIADEFEVKLDELFLPQAEFRALYPPLDIDDLELVEEYYQDKITKLERKAARKAKKSGNNNGHAKAVAG